MTGRNTLFPYVYRLGMPMFGRLFFNRYRREAMSNAVGRLLMIGVGPGTDLMFLPPAVTSVVAVEPEAAFRRMASAFASRRLGRGDLSGPVRHVCSNNVRHHGNSMQALPDASRRRHRATGAFPGLASGPLGQRQGGTCSIWDPVLTQDDR